MDFELTEQQRMFAEQVRRFAEDRLAADALKRAHAPGFPFDVARLMAEQGLLGITIPVEDGGQGGSLMDAVIAIEQVAAVCPRSADVVQAGNFGPIRTFAEYATPEQKKRFLPDLLGGRAAVISLGMTEPEAGSAVTELRTTAKADGDDMVLNGSKIFSTHSPDAAVFLIYVRFGPGVDGIGSVLVERGTPGFTIGQSSAFMSGEEWSQLYFENCRIPKANVLLGAGGFKKQIAGFNVERIGNSARALALGRHAYNLAREHAEHPQAIRPAAVRIPGPAVEIRRHGFEARIRPASCSIAPPPMPRASCRRLTRPRSPSSRAIKRASRWPTKPCRSWAVSATAGKRWRNTACGGRAAG